MRICVCRRRRIRQLSLRVWCWILVWFACITGVLGFTFWVSLGPGLDRDCIDSTHSSCTIFRMVTIVYVLHVYILPSMCLLNRMHTRYIVNTTVASGR